MYASPTWRDTTGRMWMLTISWSSDRTHNVYLVSGWNQDELDHQPEAPELHPPSRDVYDHVPDEELNQYAKFFLGQGRELLAFIERDKFKRIAALKGFQVISN